MTSECKHCKKPLPHGARDLDFCSPECAKTYKEANKTRETQKRKSVETTIEAVLKYIGIEKSNFSKSVSYRHWEKFVQFVKENSGKSWSNFVRPRLRSLIGVDFRYIDGYLDSCLAWEVMKLENGSIVFVGLPCEDVD